MTVNEITTSIKYKVFSYYSKGVPSCNYCGYNKNINALCLDHVNGDGNIERKNSKFTLRGINLYTKLLKNNFKSDFKYQVLCANCNLIKAIEEKEFSAPKPEHWKLKMSIIGKKRVFKKGKHSNRAIKVIQYDLQGNFIKEWDYIKEAEYFYNKNINAKNIVAVCNNRQKTAYGFKWKHKI